MNEQEWLTATDPILMLDFLCGRISDRKLWLFTAGCFRRLYSGPGRTHDTARKNIAKRTMELIERFVEGEVTEAEAQYYLGPLESPAFARYHAWVSASNIAQEVADWATLRKRFANRTRERRQAAREAFHSAAFSAESGAQAKLLRCIAGNPFHSMAFDPTWFTWNGSRVLKLAHAIYEGHSFDRLPLLADALEEAGCSDNAILFHAREHGEHVRGCWLLDRILGWK